MGRTIRLVVPVPPGASTDAVARLMAEQIGRAQGVTIVVENRPGASGMIGTEQVSRAAPDGATLLMTANTYLIDAQTRKANYHPVTAFDPICHLVQSPAVFVVNGAFTLPARFKICWTRHAPSPANCRWRRSAPARPSRWASPRSRQRGGRGRVPSCRIRAARPRRRR